MSRLNEKRKNSERRVHRVRKSVTVSAKRPRMSIHVSNAHISAQIIDDTKGITIASASTVGNSSAKGTMTEKAQIIGSQIGKSAKAKKVTTVAFDRGNKLYHGRIKALADAARKEGLKF